MNGNESTSLTGKIKRLDIRYQKLWFIACFVFPATYALVYCIAGSPNFLDVPIGREMKFLRSIGIVGSGRIFSAPLSPEFYDGIAGVSYFVGLTNTVIVLTQVLTKKILIQNAGTVFAKYVMREDNKRRPGVAILKCNVFIFAISTVYFSFVVIFLQGNNVSK
jgi:hypothetical protein